MAKSPSQKNQLKRPTFLLKAKHVFSSFEHFYPKRKNDRKIFSFQLNEINEKLLEKTSSVERSNSLQQQINQPKTKIELKTAAQQNNI